MTRRAATTGQLELFGSTPTPASVSRDLAVATLARQLHPLLRLGTSSWTFPGWGGLCYPERVTAARLGREGLALYGQHALFRTVGVDHTFYRLPAEGVLEAQLAQLPERFHWLEKLWSRLTAPVWPLHGGPGGRVEPNPDFLDGALLRRSLQQAGGEQLLTPRRCLLLEVPRTPPGLRPDPMRFVDSLARLLDDAPPGPRWAVELRDEALCTDALLRLLEQRGVARVLSWWTHLPSLQVQLERYGLSGPFVMVRLLLRPGTRYEERKEQFAPFDRLQAPDASMRDDLTALAHRAVREGRPMEVLVNNKAEGSAPLTVRQLAERWVGEGLTADPSPP